MAQLAEVLVAQGTLTEDQKAACLTLKQQTGRALGSIAIEQGFLTGQQLIELLSAPLSEPIEDYVPEALPELLTEMIPGEIALELQCLPVHDNGEILTVAFGNEVDDLQLERMSENTGRQIEAFLTNPGSLEAGYGLLYGHGDNGEAGEVSVADPEGDEEEDSESGIEGFDFVGGGSEDGDSSGDEGDGEENEEQDAGPEIEDFKGVMDDALGGVEIVQEQSGQSTIQGLELDPNSPAIVKLVNGILIRSLNLGASDIHIQPQEKALQVRVRVDGQLHSLMKLPQAVSAKIAARIKIMTTLNITERRLPQDGRFKAKVGSGQTEFRVSVCPSAFGEKIVIRVLGGSNLKGDVAQMGFTPRDLSVTKAALQSPTGMILVTGPTGSGKTTTLYTMLKSLNTPDKNVVTAEDPIEYTLPGLTQVPVNPDIGLSFEEVLRSFLRQDPDVILVGEIRDKPTAEIGIKAAMTGHMVLSTLHTNSAPATIMRLKNIGVDRFMLTSALKLVIAQRLVRALCDHCKTPGTLTDAEKVGLSEKEISMLGKVYMPRGCDVCRKIGYKGRRPVHEVLPVHSKAMKEAILEPGDARIGTVAREEGMLTLRENAMQLAANGVTSLEEALKVGMGD